MRRVVAIVAVLGVVTAGALWWIFSRGDALRVTAYFDRAVGVYSGSDVQVLGVRVGAVESVTPRGQQVEVVFSVDRDVAIAHDTAAVVVAPSVVSDRYVQLTDLARSGPLLADGAVIPRTRTATPVELDELYASLDTLVSALGPDGANSDGALSELLDTGAENLRGNGAAFNESVRNFAQAARTLSGSADDLFATVDELQKFTTMLAGNDRQILSVNTQLDQVWRTLSADREELSTALNTLGTALADIQAFIRDNRAAIKSNVDKLARTTQQLVDNRASIAEALDTIPLAVTNFYGAYDPASESLQGRTVMLDYFPVPLVGGGR
ncbi:ABC transporter substrate-binding protein [Actinophytocola xinjiangensis]|uniref:ABC transporter substrate-binding protein n=1 Tax=Actinophytocola xinjiangensis TaxID=485602 RepID=A0A7Z1AV90_9PSEU|nr:MCE family protein [Actinophytocola xinjiangensis]OLF05013.1 ABC transporter substrate-binding protein [Actinophytocola xinjiangensis]